MNECVEQLKNKWGLHANFNPSLMDIPYIYYETVEPFSVQKYYKYLENNEPFFTRITLQMMSSAKMKYIHRPTTTIVGQVVVVHNNKKYLVYMDKDSYMYPFDGSSTCIGIADLNNNLWKGTATVDYDYMHSNKLFV